MGPYLEKNPTQNRAGGVAEGIDTEFKHLNYGGEKKSLFVVLSLVIKSFQITGNMCVVWRTVWMQKT
jgi:hypothetical protein